jgi:hypothetical protein
VPNKIANKISDREFLNREGLCETLFSHYGMSDRLGCMISGSRRERGLISSIEEVSIDRLQSLVDGSLKIEDQPLLSAIVADRTTFDRNKTLGHVRPKLNPISRQQAVRF